MTHATRIATVALKQTATMLASAIILVTVAEAVSFGIMCWAARKE